MGEFPPYNQLRGRRIGAGENYEVKAVDRDINKISSNLDPFVVSEAKAAHDAAECLQAMMSDKYKGKNIFWTAARGTGYRDGNNTGSEYMRPDDKAALRELDEKWQLSTTALGQHAARTAEKLGIPDRLVGTIKLSELVANQAVGATDLMNPLIFSRLRTRWLADCFD